MSSLDMFPGEAHTEDPNRRYTTREFMEWIKAKAGVDAWDVDVAADAESHHAPRWFSLLPYEGSSGVDGLTQSWLPSDEWVRDRYRIGALPPIWCVFVNPPFDDLGSWVQKTWLMLNLAEPRFLHLRIAFVLPGNRHEQPFWQEMIEPYRDGRAMRCGYALECHFPPGRQAYAKPGSNGEAVGSADFPSCLLVWRRA